MNVAGGFILAGYLALVALAGWIGFVAAAAHVGVLLLAVKRQPPRMTRRPATLCSPKNLPEKAPR